jgi:integration host factor subunit alpha
MFEPLDFIEQPTLTKGDLVLVLCDLMGTTRRESREIVDSFFDLIRAELVRGHDVKVANFGNFELRLQAPRPGRNVRTGEPVRIEQRTTVKFIPSALQMDLLQGLVVQRPPKAPKRVRNRPAKPVDTSPGTPQINA